MRTHTDLKTDKAEHWMLERARQEDSGTLKDWIWLAVSCGQPVPGCLSVGSLRAVLRERGESGCGYHNT